MKKLTLILFCALCLISLNTFGQYAAGNFLLGGTINVQSTKSQSSDPPNTSFAILPSLGYFLSDNIAVGGSIGFSSSKETDNPYTYKNKHFYVGPFARFYRPLSEDKMFSVFIQTSLLFDSGKNEITGGGITAKSNSLSTYFNAGPGFAFFPGKKFAMEIILNGLSYTLYNPKGNNNNGSIFSLI